MTSVWDLLQDCLPTDHSGQVHPMHFLDEALGQDAGRAALVLGAEEAAATALGRRYPGGDLTHVRVAASWRVPHLAGGGDVVGGGAPLPADTGSRELVASVGAIEEVDDPIGLVAEIARVLAPGGVLVGSAACIEPAQGSTQRRLTPVGLRLLLEQHGLHLEAVRPGTDGVAMTTYWLHGQSVEHRAHLEETSPLNAEIEEWGRLTGRGPAQVNNRKLQHCGRFAFLARREPADGPTPWWRTLSATGAPPPVAARPRSSRGPAFREFELTLPRPVGAARPAPARGRRVLGLRRGRPAARARDRLTVQAPMGQFIPLELQKGGLAGYEPESLACYLAAGTVAGEGWMWDVGANVGVFGLLAAAVTTREVVSFEPTPALARTLRSIARANRLGVHAEELALSDEVGTATFYLSDRTDASNSLAEGFRPSTVSIEVPLETVDAYVERTGRVPAVMKIDTETTEPAVLRGAERTVAAHRPWILCEVLPGPNEAVIEQIVTGWGYALFHIDDQAVLPRRDHIRSGGTGDHRNWLFAPAEPGPEFWTAFGRWKTAISRCVPT